MADASRLNLATHTDPRQWQGPPAGRVRFFVARAPCRARFSPISVHGPAGLGTVSVHDDPGTYTAQRALRRFPYTTRHAGVRGRTAGLCTLATLFERGFVHWVRPTLYKPPLEPAF